jgi:hypothetical protein
MSSALPTATRFTALFGGDGDAQRLTASSLFCNAAPYVHLLCAAWSVVPAWTLALSIPILVPRWMIALHELFHLRSEREVDPVTRLMPFLFTFLSIGYRESLANHRSHHRHMATPADPEYYQLRGSKLAGFANAVSAPEQMWVRWVAQHGLDRELARDTAIRLALFVALISVSGSTFLWYWIPARVAFGVSYFSFFYWLHHRRDQFGVYPLAVPPWLARIGTFVWGRDVMEATLHHDAHHAQPRIAAKYLAQSRDAVLRSAG